jgi:hypothetical protein
MTRSAAALLIGIGVGTLAVQSANAASLELVRNSRPVTSGESAGGAPAGGTVHDFFVTSDADLLVLGPVLNFAVYKHPYNSNHEAPDPELVAMYPAVGASSYLRLPGDTVVLGGGFTVPGSGWGDFSNDGPQSQFQFGRLTTTQAGTFSGTFYVRGAQDPIMIPFSLALPGPGDGLLASPSAQLSLAVEEPKPQPPTPAVPLGPDLNQFTSPAFGGKVSIEITRRIRPVSASRKVFGAPAQHVHEFFVTTDTDLISVGNVEIEGNVYQHREGSDRKPPNARVLSIWPDASTDSFITTPGITRILGEGFYGHSNEAEIAWYDESDDGPLKDYLFAQLTVSQTGSFAGTINVRGPEGPVTLPFSFALPGSESDMALLDLEQTYRLELSFDEFAASQSGQVPEPITRVIVALCAPLLLRRRAA